MKSCCKEVINNVNSELAQHMHQGPYLKGKHINASINILPFWNELVSLLVMCWPKIQTYVYILFISQLQEVQRYIRWSVQLWGTCSAARALGARHGNGARAEGNSLLALLLCRHGESPLRDLPPPL